MRFFFSWDTAQKNGKLFRGWRMGDLLVELLEQEASKTCNQCGIGDCTHEAARALLSERKRQGPHWFWDNEVRKGWSYMGYQPGRLIESLLQQGADTECNKSCGAWCIHEAAREVLAIKKIVEHDPDCPDCKRLRKEQEGR